MTPCETRALLDRIDAIRGRLLMGGQPLGTLLQTHVKPCHLAANANSVNT